MARDPKAGPRPEEYLRPLDDRVVVALDKTEKVSRGGIELPDAAREVSTQGTVLAVGLGRFADNGARIPMTLKGGEHVVLGRYAGSDVPGMTGVKILRECDIMAILED